MRTHIALGLLACIGSPLAAQRPSGRIEGQVTDSVYARPLADAVVTATRVGAARETTFVARTDRRGAFQFDSLDAGRYAIRFASPLLDSLQYGGNSPLVDVSSDRPTRVALATPSGQTLRSLACPGVTFPYGTGALFGIVSDAESDRPLAGAQIAVAWSRLAVDSSKGIVADDRAAKVTVDASGQYRMCGLPTNESLLLQVQHNGRAGAVLSMKISDAAGVLVRDLSFSASGSSLLTDSTSVSGGATGTARLSGIVRDLDGKPVAGAQVRVLGTAASMRADARGAYAFTDLPAGTQELEVRQFGFGVVRGPVELRNEQRTRLDVQLQKVASLDAMSTVASRASRYPEFEQRRKEAIGGRFLDEAQIRKMNFNKVVDYVSLLPGFVAVHQRWGDMRVTSMRYPGCEPAMLVNDMPVSSLMELPPPEMLGAIEVYVTTAGAPPNHRSPCGTIVFWSRR
ncbi:MAG: carboxypeptidase regulatory-like domain-containing protein [Gemmatimonadaceae bacterium]